MSSEDLPTAATALAVVERRLHPLSWLFLLLAQLRQFAVPLIALLVFGRSGDAWWESFAAVGAVLLALHAVLQYFTYRFRIDDGELTIRSGVFQRNVRHIPLRRIQNVVLRRTLLHRLADVAEVRLESAAGNAKAEAEMRVLSLSDAAALEALVRASRSDGPADVAVDAAPPLLQVPTAELVRLGLASNRGMVVVAAAFGVFSQVRPEGIGRGVGNGIETAWGYARGLDSDPDGWLLGATVLLLAAVVLLRLFSVALVLLRFHGFTLREDGERLSVEAGLLTRLRSHAGRRKVQRWIVSDNLWLRLMGRRRLRIETAAAHSANEGQSVSELVPIAETARIDALLQRWLPAAGWERIDWQPLHPAAWRRFLTLPTLFTALAALQLSITFGAAGALLLLLMPLWLLRARQLARWSGWSVDAQHVAWRSGWLERHWQLVEIGRIQMLRVQQSPFDRRRGMASLLLDTAGANPGQPALRLRHLPEATARELCERLNRRIAAAR
jgi:putative membrane protein